MMLVAKLDEGNCVDDPPLSGGMTPSKSIVCVPNGPEAVSIAAVSARWLVTLPSRWNWLMLTVRPFSGLVIVSVGRTEVLHC